MARKRNQRLILHTPPGNGFLPISSGNNIPPDSIELHYEEYEVIHLLDYEGLSQEEASVFLEVSRPTLTRIYLSARKKIAIALSENKPIVFSQPKNNIVIKEYFCRSCQTVTMVKTETELTICPECHSKNVILLSPASTRSYSSHQGPSGHCICPQCHSSYPHIAGKPCRLQTCPKCETSLIREGSAQHQLLINRKK